MASRLETACAIVRLEPGSADRARDWARHIAENRDEAVRSLLNEGVVIESVFLGNDHEGDFLVYYMRASSIAEASKVARESTLAIDAYHRKFKESCWSSVARIELLVDLVAFGAHGSTPRLA